MRYSITLMRKPMRKADAQADAESRCTSRIWNVGASLGLPVDKLTDGLTGSVYRIRLPHPFTESANHTQMTDGTIRTRLPNPFTESVY